MDLPTMIDDRMNHKDLFVSLCLDLDLLPTIFQAHWIQYLTVQLGSSPSPAFAVFPNAKLFLMRVSATFVRKSPELSAEILAEGIQGA